MVIELNLLESLFDMCLFMWQVKEAQSDSLTGTMLGAHMVQYHLNTGMMLRHTLQQCDTGNDARFLISAHVTCHTCSYLTV